MYFDIFDDLAHNRIKMTDRRLFSYKIKYSNNNIWENLYKEFSINTCEELAYKYCLYKAKMKINSHLA